MTRPGVRRGAGVVAIVGLALAIAGPSAAAPSARIERLNEASREVAAMVALAASGQLDEALRRGEGALAAREQLLGPGAWEVAEALTEIARVYVRMGRYALADTTITRAVSVGEKLLTVEHPSSFLPMLTEQTRIVERLGDYPRAEAVVRREIALREHLGEGPVLLWSPRRTLGRLYVAEGRYAEAEALFQEAVTYFSDDDAPMYRPAHADALFGLGTVLRIRGDLRRAEALIQEALAIHARSIGVDSIEIARLREGLAALYVDKRDLTSAEPLLTQVLEVRRADGGAHHPETLRALSRLGALHRLRGDAKRAETELREALSFQRDALDPQHPEVAETAHELGLLCLARHDLDCAAPLLTGALAAREKRLGSRRALIATSLDGLAELALARGDPASAEAHLARALAVREEAFGADHPEVASTLGALGRVLLEKGDATRALAAVGRAIAIQDRRAPMILAMGNEEQKLAYMHGVRRETDLALAVQAAAPGNEEATELALATIFRRKGRVLDAMADSFAALRSRSDPVDRQLLDELAEVDAKLSALIFRGPRWTKVTRNREDLAALSLARGQIEAAVSERAGELRDRDGFMTVARVRSAIPVGAALIELFVHRPLAPRRDGGDGFGPPRLTAFVLGREGLVHRADLGEAAAIDALVSNLRPALASRALDPKPAARALDAAVMAKVRALLGETRWLFVSPDGALNLIPLGALVDEQGRYLIETHAFTYLTSGADLATFGPSIASREPPLILASPAFGDRRGRVGTPPSSRSMVGEDPVFDPSKIRFPALPETAVEGKLIQYFFPGSRVLIGAEASEAALKKVHGPRVLHLATHGYFLPRPSGDATGGLADPLLRSGLALAFANERESPAGEDGILTARELATGVDLAGTRLVVLSACETGVGDVSEGDGVFGLRRALVLAGAETQVMSLWKVDDLSTRNLMVGYYRRLLAGGGRSESLRQVALEMLAKPETAHPERWASFIVSGNGATLDGGAAVPRFARVAPGVRGCGCALIDEADAPSFEGAAALLALVALRRLRARR